MCTIHADSSAGAFRRIASYAVQAPERLPLEASNLLIAGAINLVVHLDVDLVDPLESPRESSGRRWVGEDDPDCGKTRFSPMTARRRFVSSIREVVDADGVQVVSNEVYAPGSDRRAVAVCPLRPETLSDLHRVGYEHRSSAMVGALP
jgi:hypothetical protein